MKRTLLVVLMVVMITTPCFALEVETDGIFSLDGTLWRITGQIGRQGYYYGFNQGNVYYLEGSECWKEEVGFYVDSLLTSIFMTYSSRELDGKTYVDVKYGNMLPIGIGFTTGISKSEDGDPRINRNVLIKWDYNWTSQECTTLHE